MLIPALVIASSLATAAGPIPTVDSDHTLAVGVAVEDARLIQPKHRPYMRYFWVPETGTARIKLRIGMKLLLNSTSREAFISDVTEVKPWLWRIDTRDFKYNPAVLENAKKIDIFFHEQVEVVKAHRYSYLSPPGVYDGKLYKGGWYQSDVKVGDLVPTEARWLPQKDIKELREMLYTETPILNAAFFLSRASTQIDITNNLSGIGYYDLLEIKSRDDYWKLIGFDPKIAANTQREMRAVMEFSGVNPIRGGRQAARLGNQVWVTLDNDKGIKRGVAIRNLDPKEFKHKAEEWYGPLPNELPAYGLFNDKGVIQNNAPADLFGFGHTSPLNTSKDIRIHIFLACIECHAEKILQPLDCYVRAVYQNPRALGTDVSRKKYLEGARLYFRDIEYERARDATNYQRRILEASKTPVTPKLFTVRQAIVTLSQAVRAYNDKVTVSMAAREVGLSSQRWLKILRWHQMKRGKLDPSLMPFLTNPPKDITRQTWEDIYPIAMTIKSGYLPD